MWTRVIFGNFENFTDGFFMVNLKHIWPYRNAIYFSWCRKVVFLNLVDSWVLLKKFIAELRLDSFVWLHFVWRRVWKSIKENMWNIIRSSIDWWHICCLNVLEKILIRSQLLLGKHVLLSCLLKNVFRWWISFWKYEWVDELGCWHFICVVFVCILINYKVRETLTI